MYKCGGGGWYGGESCPTSVERTGKLIEPGECDPGWEPIEDVYNENNVTTLANLLTQNPTYLVNLCFYIDQYLYLTTFKAPQNVPDRLHQVNQLYLNSSNASDVTAPTYLQDINDASSAVINFDYFPIRITALPKENGVQMTPQRLFEYFRSHWNDFIDNSIASFYPYQDAIVNDATCWNSTNPMATLFHLNMIDNGTVIVSDHLSSMNKVTMTVTTVKTPLDGTHPVSGNRSWGIDVDPNGGYFFYTTASDRITGVAATVFNTWAERLPVIKSGFESADALWRSLQTKMIQFINNNGGKAGYYSLVDYIVRPDWEDIDLY